jgi:hypothetical protein
MALSRPKKAALVGLGVLLVTAISGFKIKGMLDRGEPVFWLAELWVPAAFLSIGLVTCVEFLLPASAPAAASKAPAKRRR